VCREVVAIVPLLREEFVEAREAIGRRDVPLPSAGQIWWRAAVHARADAARAGRASAGVGFTARAAACFIGLVAAGLSWLWPSVAPVFDRAGVFTARLAPVADMAMTTLRAELPIVIVVALCLIAAPVALYFALREE
jgi:hypothetical protein